ncbi:MAG: MFS transporter, partial [Mycobacteriaceae bacterium]
VFYINVPLGIMALVVVWRVLNLPVHRRDAKVDWWGAVLLAVALVPLLIVAEQGRTWGWSSGTALLCFAVGLAGIAAFIAAELRMGDDALIPMRFFRNSIFSVGVVVSVVAGAAMFGGISLLPLYLQVAKGSSPTLAGYQILPMVLGMMSASILSGQLIARTGRYKVYPIIGTGLITVGMVLFSFVHADTPLWQSMLIMLMFGLGLGNMLQPLTLAIQNAMPPKDMGVSTAAATFFRQIGATLGVAVFLSLLFSELTPKIADSLRTASGQPEFQQALKTAATGADPVQAGLAQGILKQDPSVAGSALTDTAFIQKLDPILAAPFKMGFSNAMDVVFIWVAVVMFVGFIMVWFFKEIPLRGQSGLAAQQSDRDAAAASAQAALSAEDAPFVEDVAAGGERTGQPES